MMKSDVTLVFACKEKRTYRFLCQDTKANQSQTIQYTAVISRDKKWKYSTPIYLVERSKQQIFPSVDHPLAEAIAMSSTLGQQLRLQISEQGEILQLINIKEIQAYWQTRLKIQLESQYEGGVIDTMINQLDEVVEEEARFVGKLQKDVFFNHLWGILPGTYQYQAQGQNYIKPKEDQQGIGYRYEIDVLENKGTRIKGIGEQAKERLAQVKELWQLEGDEELTYEGIIEGELNEQSEIVKLSSKEVYTYGSAIYRSTIIKLDLC
ncbi:hypothetical protein [Myroides sp. C6-3]|uniref:hypothetical protein n=1 Tax=Myroides sp. C6-3 TaxID=3400535 RepID=UPI003D2F7F29